MRRSLACLWLVVLSACAELGRDDGLFEAADTSGSLRVPLSGADNAGRRYQLRGATFEISGSAMLTLSQDGQRARHKALVSPLPPGGYQVFLRAGYQLVEVLADGSEQPVLAQLSARNPVSVEVQRRGDHQLSLSFRRADADEPSVILFGPQAASALARATSHADVLASAQASP